MQQSPSCHGSGFIATEVHRESIGHIRPSPTISGLLRWASLGFTDYEGPKTLLTLRLLLATQQQELPEKKLKSQAIFYKAIHGTLFPADLQSLLLKRARIFLARPDLAADQLQLDLLQQVLLHLTKILGGHSSFAQQMEHESSPSRCSAASVHLWLPIRERLIRTQHRLCPFVGCTQAGDAGSDL